MANSRYRRNLLNYGLYQVGWLAIVLGVAREAAVLGSAVALAALVAHLLVAGERRVELRLLGPALGLGLVFESIDLALGLIVVPSLTLGFLPPLWLLLFWPQFAALQRFCLDWLAGRYVLAAILGAIGGPLAFLTGERLGAIALSPDRFYALSGLAFLWALALPLLVFVADRFEPRSGSYGTA